MIDSCMDYYSGLVEATKLLLMADASVTSTDSEGKYITADLKDKEIQTMIFLVNFLLASLSCFFKNTYFWCIFEKLY